jgi:hypothetical protein
VKTAIYVSVLGSFLAACSRNKGAKLQQTGEGTSAVERGILPKIALTPELENEVRQSYPTHLAEWILGDIKADAATQTPVAKVTLSASDSARLKSELGSNRISITEKKGKNKVVINCDTQCTAVAEGLASSENIIVLNNAMIGALVGSGVTSTDYRGVASFEWSAKDSHFGFHCASAKGRYSRCAFWFANEAVAYKPEAKYEVPMAKTDGGSTVVKANQELTSGYKGRRVADVGALSVADSERLAVFLPDKSIEGTAPDGRRFSVACSSELKTTENIYLPKADQEGNTPASTAGLPSNPVMQKYYLLRWKLMMKNWKTLSESQKRTFSDEILAVEKARIQAYEVETAQIEYVGSQMQRRCFIEFPAGLQSISLTGIEGTAAIESIAMLEEMEFLYSSTDGKLIIECKRELPARVKSVVERNEATRQRLIQTGASDINNRRHYANEPTSIPVMQRQDRCDLKFNVN